MYQPCRVHRVEGFFAGPSRGSSNPAKHKQGGLHTLGGGGRFCREIKLYRWTKGGVGKGESTFVQDGERRRCVRFASRYWLEGGRSFSQNGSSIEKRE